MRPFSELTDVELVTEYAGAKAYADELYARLDDYKHELMLRFKESGQLNFDCPTHTVTIKKQPPSVAWLKREYGFADGELSSECMVEKISLTPDWDRVKDWLEGQSMDWRESYTPAIKAKTMKV
jgi:hypothetical protein